MEFCHACNQRYMPRLTSTDAKVVFECEICHRRINGLPEDTLWYEEARVKEDERFQMYLERAGHDLAGKTVAYEDISGTSSAKPIACSCGRQYMTLVRVGKSANTLYVCECGIVINAATGAQIPHPNNPTRAEGRASAAASSSAASSSAKK